MQKKNLILKKKENCFFSPLNIRMVRQAHHERWRVNFLKNRRFWKNSPGACSQQSPPKNGAPKGSFGYVAHREDSATATFINFFFKFLK